MDIAHDLVNEYKSGQSLVPLARTSTGTGTGVDFQDCGKEVYAFNCIGAASGDVGSITKLQESSDNSTFTDISGAVMAEMGPTSDNTLQTLMAVRTKRYVRAVNTITGSSTPSITSGVLLMAKKKSY